MTEKSPKTLTTYISSQQINILSAALSLTVYPTGMGSMCPELSDLKLMW